MKRLSIILFSLLLLTLLPTLALNLMAQDNTTDNPFEFSVRVDSNGQPGIHFASDLGVTWLHVWIGTPAPDYTTTLNFEWYEVAKVAKCANGVCSLTPTFVYPTNGQWEVWVQAYTDKWWNDDPTYYSGPKLFNVNFPSEEAPVPLTRTEENGKQTFTWQQRDGVTWYHVWMGTLNPVKAYVDTWKRADELGCGITETTICTLEESPFLNFGKSYTWYVQGWGPAGFTTGGLEGSGWAQGDTFENGVAEFGLGGNVMADPFDVMRSAGMTWVKRTIIFDIDGAATDMGLATSFIAQAKNENFKLLLSIQGEIADVRDRRAQFITEYTKFVGDVAALMDDGGAIEIFSEPNLDREWPNGQISGANYMEVLRPAYEAIKANNSSVMVISGAPSPTGAEQFFPGAVVNDDNFLRQIRDAGGANYFDCLGVHYNEGIISPNQNSGDPRSEHYTRYYNAMKSTYLGIFPDKPLCFTEIGYLTPEGGFSLSENFSWAAGTSLAEHAQWHGEAAALSKADPNVLLHIIWNVDFTSGEELSDPVAAYAMVRPGGSCPSCAPLKAAVEN